MYEHGTQVLLPDPLPGNGLINNHFPFFLCIYFLPALWLCCSGQALSSCSKQGYSSLQYAMQASHSGGFLLWSTGSRLVGSVVVKLGLLPRPGIKPMSPALSGKFLTTEPPEKFSYLTPKQPGWNSFDISKL